jgi:outer membrane cobalamin receptor
MLFSILSAGLISLGLSAEPIELADSITTATVTADKGVIVSRVDYLTAEHARSISDILNLSSGLHVGDNGGLSGLKTVSLRGLGSAHTAIYVDGVRIGNVQSGQNDLGMLPLEDMYSASVDYAQNSVSFRTARPEFGALLVAGKVRLYAGSFGTYLPSARLDFRLSDNVSLSVNAAGAISKGNFTYADGLERTNNDLKQLRGGLDLFGLTDGGDYHVKAYYSSAERGTPGAISWPSDDRQADKNAFIQGYLHQVFSPLYTLHLSAKGSYDDIYYTSAWGDSQYGQTELQLNSAHDFQLTRWWKMSLAADVQWDGLASTLYDASRTTVFSALASSFNTDRLLANIAVEFNGAFDADALSRYAFSPSADIRYRVFDGFDVLAFGRRAYRVPTFNELYYVGYGNPELRPEDAWLTDVGVDFNRSIACGWTIKAKLDGFANFLTDKITSAPSPEDPNIWAPYNIGKVRSLGLDLAAGFVWQSTDCRCAFDAKYTLLSATDRTPDSYSFGQQIPYIAKHTVVLNAEASWKGWSLIPVWQLRSGRSDGYGDLNDWNTLDLTLAKDIKLSKTGPLSVKLSVRNMFDNRYEVSSGYPMPGRSIIGGLEYKF